MKKHKSTPDLVDRVMASKIEPSTRLVRLFIVTQLHYRAPLGDKAWDKLRDIIGPDAVTALAYIAGFQMAWGLDLNNPETGKKRKRFYAEILPELDRESH